MGSIYKFAIAAVLSFFVIGPAANGALVKDQPLTMRYHNGALLKGDVTVNLVWYGKFTPAQRAVVADFVQSLSPTKPAAPEPSAAAWWSTTEKYKGAAARVVLGRQVVREAYTLGKSLRGSHLAALAGAAGPGSVSVVLTAADVAVEGFCMSRCGTHGSTGAGRARRAYVWVGNSEAQCPGQCAWPFHRPIYGPQTPPLVAPSGDVGADGIVINLATLLAGTVTNPFRSGYFQGPAAAPLEAVSACTGLFGSGAYPGYPGRVLTDPATGASFNAHGVNGRRFLLPAMWDPQASTCKTLV